MAVGHAGDAGMIRKFHVVAIQADVSGLNGTRCFLCNLTLADALRQNNRQILFESCNLAERLT
jgi:hypothetical protein